MERPAKDCYENGKNAFSSSSHGTHPEAACSKDAEVVPWGASIVDIPVPLYVDNTTVHVRHELVVTEEHQKTVEVVQETVVQQENERRQPIIDERIIHMPKYVDAPVVRKVGRVIDVSKRIEVDRIIEVPRTVLVDEYQDYPVIKKVQQIVNVPYVERSFSVVDKLLVEEQEEVVEVPRVETTEHIEEVATVRHVQKYVEVPLVEKIQKFVDVQPTTYHIAVAKFVETTPVEHTQHRVIEVPRLDVVDTVVDVPHIHQFTKELRYNEQRVEIPREVAETVVNSERIERVDLGSQRIVERCYVKEKIRGEDFPAIRREHHVWGAPLDARVVHPPLPPSYNPNNQLRSSVSRNPSYDCQLAPAVRSPSPCNPNNQLPSKPVSRSPTPPHDCQLPSPVSNAPRPVTAPTRLPSSVSCVPRLASPPGTPPTGTAHQRTPPGTPPPGTAHQSPNMPVEPRKCAPQGTTAHHDFYGSIVDCNGVTRPVIIDAVVRSPINETWPSLPHLINVLRELQEQQIVEFEHAQQRRLSPQQVSQLGAHFRQQEQNLEQYTAQPVRGWSPPAHFRQEQNLEQYAAQPVRGWSPQQVPAHLEEKLAQAQAEDARLSLRIYNEVHMRMQFLHELQQLEEQKEHRDELRSLKKAQEAEIREVRNGSAVASGANDPEAHVKELEAEHKRHLKELKKLQRERNRYSAAKQAELLSNLRGMDNDTFSTPRAYPYDSRYAGLAPWDTLATWQPTETSDDITTRPDLASAGLSNSLWRSGFSAPSYPTSDGLPSRRPRKKRDENWSSAKAESSSSEDERETGHREALAHRRCVEKWLHQSLNQSYRSGLSTVGSESHHGPGSFLAGIPAFYKPPVSRQPTEASLFGHVSASAPKGPGGLPDLERRGPALHQWWNPWTIPRQPAGYR